MSLPSGWRDAEDPAALFLRIWAVAVSRPREELANAIKPTSGVTRALAEALWNADAVSRMCDALERAWHSGDQFPAARRRAGLVLNALRAIDEIMLRIHPRSVLAPAGVGLSHPDWLDDIREKRTLTGSFAIYDQFTLIPRGPFGRSPRLPLEQSTFLLGDQLAALSVIEPARFRQDGRPLIVEVKVVDHSADRGVAPRPGRAGSELITFVPLAEKSDALVMDIWQDEGTTFVDYLKGNTFDPYPAFKAAIDANLDCDILMAPELTVDRADIAAFSAALAALSSGAPRLVVAGSALIPRDGDELPWNEAFILNSNGAVLWTHRKITGYGMLEETSKGLKDKRLAGVTQLMDAISWSEKIIIVDIDTLGRCLVLICQDLQMEAVPDLLMELRPDWVLVPILDSGTALGRWPGRRAVELSAFSEARFAIVSSLTMKHWLKKWYEPDGFGVAIGPKYINHGDRTKDNPGAMAEVGPESDHQRYGSVKWRSRSGWRIPSRP